MTGKARDSYLELVHEFPLTAIRSERQLKAAQRVLDELLARGKLSRGELAYVDALSDLIAAYEDDHYSMPATSDADMLRHLLESKGVTPAEFCRAEKVAPSVISEVLSGRRKFSKGLIGKLAHFFNVDKSILAANF